MRSLEFADAQWTALDTYKEHPVPVCGAGGHSSHQSRGVRLKGRNSFICVHAPTLPMV